MPDTQTGDIPLETAPEPFETLEPVYARLRNVIPEVEWGVHAPVIAAILKLKHELGAVILAHNYQPPEIFHGVADITGDSLELARRAVDTEAEVIVLCGVRFMAETAKLLNPDKTVLIPDAEAGCSLASAVSAENVRALKQRYPGVPVVAYVNTSAAVKAEADICCTSSNAVEVVDSLGTDRVIFIPDRFLGRWVALHTDVDVITPDATCEVHKRFTASDIRDYRASHPGICVLAHPECPPEVLDEADFVGSTAGMQRYLRQKRPRRAMMLTECTMSDNVRVELPEVEFLQPCNLCPHMRLITLPKILQCLQQLAPRVDVAADVAVSARRALTRMLDLQAQTYEH